MARTSAKSATKPARHPLYVGNAVLIRTVTNYYTGRIASITKDDVLLEDAAWIASTGRFAECLREGKADEVEPYPDGIVAVSRGAFVDVCNWNHEPPREVK